MAVSADRRGARLLVERLEARRDEIEQTLLTRVYAVQDPGEVGDPEYALGLRAAVGAALGYSLAALGEGDRRGAEVPFELLAQARMAARNGVSLDTVLRRYFAGYTLLSDCLTEEAEPASGPLREALRTQSALFDRLLNAVTEAYGSELERRRRHGEARQVSLVKRILDGDLVDLGGFGYELAGSHLGVVAAGPGSPEALRGVAAALDRRLLLVRVDRSSVWAWLGGRGKVTSAEVAEALESGPYTYGRLAFGEPGHEIEGWRVTHRQAKAAFTVATRTKQSTVSYGEVSLVASALENEILAGSLQRRYLAPLRAERDGGARLRRTLNAYFAAGRNAATAAAALGVSRQTVNSRLQAVESRIEQSLGSCAPELETALRLHDLESPPLT